MAQTKKTYRQTLSGSIGAGMSSVFKPNSRRYYILEHKVSSRYHKAGEAQEIIVDQIELGRDSHCQVRFDDHFSTVSRRHAAIVKDGDGWKLVQVSKTNTTLLNGHPVRTEWYLQNGDEIQLSINGPKLGFIIPTGNKATVGSIGLTRRLSLFRQQALRPYKTAIMSMAAALVLALGIGGWVIYGQDKTITEQKVRLDQLSDTLSVQQQLLAQQEVTIDSFLSIKPTAKVVEKTVVQQVTVPSKGGGGSKVVYVKVPQGPAGSGSGGNTGGGTIVSPPKTVDFSVYYPHIYQISAVVKFSNGEILQLPDGSPFGWVGTGFLLNDGKFVTAGHVVSPNYELSHFDYSESDGIVPKDILGYYYLMINAMMINKQILVDFDCVNYQGKHLTFNSNQVRYDDSNDKEMVTQVDVNLFADLATIELMKLKEKYGSLESIPEEILNQLDEQLTPFKKVVVPAGSHIKFNTQICYDYAYINIGGGGLKANKTQSTQLKQGTKLYSLGYPHGWSKGSEPIYSESTCARNGLNTDSEGYGTIQTSNENTEGGDSGGPVFYDSGNGWEVIGILSGSNRAKGRVTPISMVP